MAKKPKKRFTTGDIQNAMRKKYAQPEYALLFEVNNGTGMNGGRRYADGMAMSLWPSRGLHLHGFEFKVSRPDWVKEMKDPSKAELFHERTHFWWLVTANDIVKPGEVPEPWGHMELTGRGLTVVKPAPISNALDLTWEWFAALMRRAGAVSNGMIEAAVEARVGDLRKGVDERVDRLVSQRTGEADRLKDLLKSVYEGLGLDWDERATRFAADGQLLDIVQGAKILKAAGLDRDHASLISAARNIRRIAAKLDETIQPIEYAVETEARKQAEKYQAERDALRANRGKRLL